MMIFGFGLLAILTCFSLSHALEAKLGSPQVCRCYSADTPNVCPNPTSPKLSSLPNKGSRKCVRKIRMKVEFIADDAATLFICGQIVAWTLRHTLAYSGSYRGPCDDIIFWFTNSFAQSGVALLIEVNGQKYGTTDASGKFLEPGTEPLLGITAFRPTGSSFNNPEDFDFSAWKPAIVVDEISRLTEKYRELSSQGAFPIGLKKSSSPLGSYGLRIELPFCK